MAEKVLCIRPSCFEYNEDTARSNSFQSADGLKTASETQTSALAEFDGMMLALKAADVSVVVIEDHSRGSEVQTPDSIFPNNWFSTHLEFDKDTRKSKTLVLYPMCGVNRRAERRNEDCQFLWKAADRIVDYTPFEEKEQFLEGTGSMVLDHQNRCCYAAISVRTDQALVKRFCDDLSYKPVTFVARRTINSELLYHTNVMMSIGPDWIICCSDIICGDEERAAVVAHLKATGRKLITITEAQLDQFCGNVLSIKTKKGKNVTVMSQTALDAFNADQIRDLGEIITVKIPTIEKYGGGSARCMLAELFFD